MRWRTGRRSSNVEDLRGRGGGLPGGIRIGGGRGLGLGGIIIILIVSWLLGINPLTLLEGGLTTGTQPFEDTRPTDTATTQSGQDEMKEFVSVVLADTEVTWHGIMQEMGSTYREPKLVLFSGAVNSACGFAQSAVGPFYCPADEKVYIDLDFYRDLRDRFRAPGDFAQAYVIAHEVGHHVQKLLGIEQKVRQVQSQASRTEANRLSVLMELQADCFAGLWAYHADQDRGRIEPGDFDEALTAASAIGDDRLQKESTGRVTPDSFTHGTSEQRMRWFQTGLRSGNPQDCDTFSAAQP